MRSAAALALLVAASACQPVSPHAPDAANLRLPAEVLVRSQGHVVTVSLDDYTLGSVLAEVSPVGESATTAARIFEVQAVLARTYAVAELGRHRSDGFDLCDSTHCQLYDPARIRTSSFAAMARQAVRTTSGRVLIFHGRVAETFFHADCGGATADADAVWGGETIPYLLGAPDLIATAKHRTWTASVSLADLVRAVSADPATSVGRHLDTLEVQTRDASGRAETVALHGETTRLLPGDQFRAVINRALGDRTLDSTKFSLSRTGTGYRFVGTGFGHGVGLCQVGAAARARRGDTLEAILGQYFPGAVLTR
jgi:stage II sporulation protein D